MKHTGTWVDDLVFMENVVQIKCVGVGRFFWAVPNSPISPHVTGSGGGGGAKKIFTFEPSYQNKSCSECQKPVSQLSLLSLVIKIKVVHNVNRISKTSYLSHQF